MNMIKSILSVSNYYEVSQLWNWYTNTHHINNEKIDYEIAWYAYLNFSLEK